MGSEMCIRDSDRTGDVREMSTRKEPEKAIMVLAFVSVLKR